MRRPNRITPKISLKPTVYFCPSSVPSPNGVQGVVGWAYVHPKSLGVVSGSYSLGHRLDSLPFEFCREARPLLFRWQYRDKMRLHYPFVREYSGDDSGRVTRACMEGIRRFSAENDLRMTCSQYRYACEHLTGHSEAEHSLVMDRLESFGHSFPKEDIAQAHALVFLYYEQRDFWRYLHEQARELREIHKR